MNIKSLSQSLLLFLAAAFLFASCSSVKYTYYKKHKVPYSAPEEVKFAKSIPNKPFLAQAEEKLKEVADVKQTAPVTKAEAKNALKEIRDIAKESEKIANNFDINKFLGKNNLEIKMRGSESGLDDRTTIIVLLIILILVLLALIGDGLLWLLWLALVVFLILLLIRYLGLFN